MTREEFLRDPVPNMWIALGQQEVPPDWIREAWNNRAFRENITYEFVRGVRKLGDLGDCQYWLGVLPGILTDDEVVSLYIAIRDESHRYEDEWRGEFEAAFPNVVDKLPHPKPVD